METNTALISREAMSPAEKRIADQRERLAKTDKKPPKKLVRKVESKKKVKESDNGDRLTSLKKLCADLNLDPRLARRRLRKAPLSTSHDAKNRWAWKSGSAELKEVKKLLSK